MEQIQAQLMALLSVILLLDLILSGTALIIFNKKATLLPMSSAVIRAATKGLKRLIAWPSKASYSGAKKLGKARLPWWAKPFAWAGALSLWILAGILSIFAEVAGAQTKK